MSFKKSITNTIFTCDQITSDDDIESTLYANVKLECCDISHIAFKKCRFVNCFFSCCKLENVHFVDCVFIDCYVNNCNISNFTLDSTRLERVLFSESSIDYAGMKSAQNTRRWYHIKPLPSSSSTTRVFNLISYATFIGCTLEKSCIGSGIIEKTNFIHSSFKQVSFINMGFFKALFYDVDLDQVRISKSDFKGLKIKRSDKAGLKIAK